jgi:cytochrome c oxidase subunit 1
MRFELDYNNNRLICYENINGYLMSISLHGLLMIFFLVMPALFGSIGNYLLPIYLAASEVIYPRMNNIAVLLLPISFIIMMVSLISEYGSGVGWTLYPPLSTCLIGISRVGMDFILYSLIVSGISTSLTSVNLIVSVHIWKLVIIPLSSMDIYV